MKLQQSLSVCPVAHYHRVEDVTYYAVIEFLRDVLRVTVMQGKPRFSRSLSPFLLTQILYFVDQMETAYLHPRATSRRWSMHCQPIRENKPKSKAE